MCISNNNQAQDQSVRCNKLSLAEVSNEDLALGYLSVFWEHSQIPKIVVCPPPPAQLFLGLTPHIPHRRGHIPCALFANFTAVCVFLSEQCCCEHRVHVSSQTMCPQNRQVHRIPQDGQRVKHHDLSWGLENKNFKYFKFSGVLRFLFK